jgi:CHAD domain-containing protein
MAYRLERGESVISGLKRVINEEIESAGDQLSGEKREKNVGRDEAIHDARKSIKKVRAILRLVREEMGETFRKENVRLRDIAGRLSEFRDAFAIIETFDDLKNKFKGELPGMRLRSVRAGLTKRRNESGREEDVTIVLSAAAAALRRTARRVKSWHFGTDEFKSGAGYAAIAPGLAAAYTNGRKALARARKDPTPENFHELRKRVKDTWYHMRLLECLWSEVIIAYEKSLKDLETWLGNDHNLVVLQDVIALEPAFFGKEKDIQLTFDLIARYQKELRDEAIPLAERIYQEKPREFTRRMKHLWDTWQSEANAPGPSGNRTAA